MTRRNQVLRKIVANNSDTYKWMLFEHLMTRDCPTNLIKAGVYKKRRNSKALVDSGISKFRYEVVRKPEI